MKTMLAVAIVMIFLMLGFVFYRSHYSPAQLNVEPHAKKEIEKAKQR